MRAIASVMPVAVCLAFMLSFAPESAAFIYGYDDTQNPPVANNSVLVELGFGSSRDRGGQISAIVYPYSGGTPSDSADHSGRTGDNGLGNDIDRDAGSKIAVKYTAGGNTVQYGNYYGWGSSTGPDGNFVESSATEYSFNRTPDGNTEAVIVRVMEPPAGAPAALRVTQKVIIRGNLPWFATIYYLENADTIPITDVQFFQGMDWNFNGSYTGDNCRYDSSSDTVYGVDTNATGSQIAYGGYRSDRASVAHEVNRYWRMWGNIRNDSLSNRNSYNGDASTALKWSLGNLAPGSRTALPIVWGMGTNQASMADNIDKGMSVLYDVGIQRIASPDDGVEYNPVYSPTVPLEAVAALYGLVDQRSVPVYVLVTGPVNMGPITVDSVDFSVPLTETVSVNYSWDISTTPAGAYTVTFFDTLAGDQDADNNYKSITVYISDLVVKPDVQSKRTVENTSVPFTLGIYNAGAADRMNIGVSPSTSSWKSMIYTTDGIKLAEDWDGDGTFDWVDPSWDTDSDGRPDIYSPAGRAAFFRLVKYVPSYSYNESDTTTVTVTAVSDTTRTDTGTCRLRAASEVAARKQLYLHSDLSMDTTYNTASSASVSIAEYSDEYYTMSPAFSTDFELTTAPVDVELYIASPVNAEVNVQLFAYVSGDLLYIGEDTQTVAAGSSGAAPTDFSLTPTGRTLIPAGYALMLKVSNRGSASINVYHQADRNSCIDMETYTYVHVDVAGTWDAAYPGGDKRYTFVAGDTCSLRADVSDPFGVQDIGDSASGLTPVTLTVTDPSGTVVLNGVQMNNVTNNAAGSPSDTFEYVWPVPSSAVPGTYTATAVALEKNGVRHERSFEFEVVVPTAVRMGDVIVCRDGEGVPVVQWETLTESDSAGFVVRRGFGSDAASAEVLGGLVPARGSGIHGAEYSFRDEAGRLLAGPLYYFIEEIGYNGERSMYGPYVLDDAGDDAASAAAVTTGGGTAPGVDGAVGSADGGFALTVGPVRILQSTPSGYVCELLVPQWRRTVSGDGVVRYEAPGVGNGRVESGGVEFASCNVLLEVPEGADAEGASVEVLEVSRTLLDTPDAAADDALDGAEAGGSVVRILDNVRSGGRDKLVVGIRPFSFGRDGVTLAERILFRITFPAAPAVEDDARPRAAACLEISTPSDPGVSLPAEWLDVEVPEDGIYRVYGTAFSLAGVDPSSVATASLCLERKGEPWSMRVVGSSADPSVLGPDGYVEFFGVAEHGKYETSGWYRLSWDGTHEGRRAEVVSVEAAAVSTVGVGAMRVETSNPIFYYEGAPGDDDLDRWFQGLLTTVATQSFTVSLPDGLQTTLPAVIEVGVLALGELEGEPDHAVAVSVDGTPAGTFTWDGKGYEIGYVTLDTAGACLHPGENTILLEAVPTGSDYYLADYVAVHYFAATSATGGVLDAVLPAERVRLDGFSASQIVVWDVSEPALSRVITGGSLSAAADGTWSLSWSSDVLSRARIYAAAAPALHTAPNVEYHRRSHALLDGPGAELVIVTRPLFQAECMRLAALRSAAGLSTMVLLWDEIRAQFGFRCNEPSALRAFLHYAYHEWSVRPRYVLIVGDATCDPLNRTGKESDPTVLVPAKFVYTSSDDADAMEAPSDWWYALVDGDDDMPDLAVGRIPVRDVTTLHGIVDKLVEYASIPAGSAFEKRVALVADDDEAVFSQEISSAASRVSTRFDVFESTIPAVDKATLLSEFDLGRVLFSYVGHAALYQLAAEDILADSDAPSVAVSAPAPVVVTFGCLDGYFAVAGDSPWVSIAESMLRQYKVLDGDGRGAAAVFSSSSKTSPEAKRNLCDEFFRAMFGERRKRLGDVVLDAMEGFRAGAWSDTVAAEVMLTHNLLGDPSMDVAVPFPGRVETLSASKGDGVVLRWSAVTDPDLAGYMIYRSVGDTESFVPLTRQPVQGESYVDADAPSSSAVYYLVRAVDAEGFEGASSPLAAVSPSSASGGGGGGGCCMGRVRAGRFESLSWFFVAVAAPLCFLLLRARRVERMNLGR